MSVFKKNIISYNKAKWAALAIVAYTALLYTRALFNNFANWDDDNYIIVNPFIKDFSLSGIKAIFTSFYIGNYHPLTTLTYLFEYTCFGLNPFPYHLFNVLLHLINTWLVYKLTEKFSGNHITALIVSLLFAIHPMHVESVAWISERKDVLYSFFYLLSLIVYMRYIYSGNKFKYYIGSLLLFFAACLSKPAAVTIPALLIILDFYKSRKINAKTLFEKIPFVVIAVLFGILAIWSQREGGAIKDLSLTYNFTEKIFLISYSVSFYIIKSIIPFGLCTMHYYPVASNGVLPWQYYASLPFLLFIVFLIIRCHSFRKEIIFGFLFFLITVSVMLQVIHVGGAHTAERYTYIPYIGLFYIAGQFLSNIVNRQAVIVTAILFFVFILMFSYIAFVRIGIWKNGETLFTDVINKNPDYYHGYWIRGNIRHHKGNFRGALQDYDKTMKCKSDYIPCISNREEVRIKLNYYGKELDDLNKLICGNSANGMAYNNRGILRAKTGDIEGAMNDFNMAIKFAHYNAETYGNRGNLKNLQKNYAGAIEDYNYSLKLKPCNNLVYYNRGISRFFLGDTSGACEDWKKAAALGYKDVLPIVKQYCR